VFQLASGDEIRDDFKDQGSHHDALFAWFQSLDFLGRVGKDFRGD